MEAWPLKQPDAYIPLVMSFIALLRVLVQAALAAIRAACLPESRGTR